MNRVILASTLGAVALTLCSQSRADVITHHAETSLFGTGPDAAVLFDMDSGPLDSYSTDSETATGLGTAASGYASAYARLQPSGRIVLSSEAFASASRDVYYVDENPLVGFAQQYTETRATWYDVLYLGTDDPNIVGHSVRITFDVEGTIWVQSSYGNLAVAETQKYIYGHPNHGSTVSNAVGVRMDGNGLSSDGGWDEIEFHGNADTGEFQGSFHLDIPILQGDPYVSGVPGSIAFEAIMTLTAIASPTYINLPSIGTAYVSDPISLTSITLPDVGNVTPESLGLTLKFDSGARSPNIPVPEPSSLAAIFSVIAAFSLRISRRYLRPAR